MTVLIGASEGVIVSIAAGNTIVLLVPAGTNPVHNMNVTVRRADYDNAVLADAYLYNPLGSVVRVSPRIGPVSGNFWMTIVGSNLGDVSTALMGLAEATVVSQSSTHVVVSVPAASQAGTVNVTLISVSFGTTVGVQLFTYAMSTITALSPSSLPAVGGVVTIIGQTLGNGSDVTAVLLDNNWRAQILSQNSSVVVVRVPDVQLLNVGGVLTVGVMVESQLFGNMSRASAFSYIFTVVQRVVPGRGSIAGGTVVAVIGEHFGNGSEPVAVTFGTTPTASVSVVNSSYLVCVVPLAVSAGTVNVGVQSSSYGSASLAGGFVYYEPMQIISVTPNNGPLVGGNTVTIVGLNFAFDVSSMTVLIGAQSTTIASVSSDEIVIVAPASSVSGWFNMTILRSGYDEAVGVAYRYNDRGSIVSVVPSSGSVSGGAVVTIFGTDMANDRDGDVRVWLCGVAAQVLVYNGSMIAALTGNSTYGQLGSAVVLSTSHGESVLNDAYTYVATSALRVVAQIGEDVTLRIPPEVVIASDLPLLNISLENGSDLPSWLLFNSSSLSFSGRPPVSLDGIGTIRLNITARLGINGPIVWTASLQFVVNRPPFVVLDSSRVEVTATIPFLFTVPLRVTDADGDTIHMSAVESEQSVLPDWLVFDGASATFSGEAPKSATTGNETGIFIVIRASDATSSGMASFELLILPAPPPIALIIGLCVAFVLFLIGLCIFALCRRRLARVHDQENACNLLLAATSLPLLRQTAFTMEQYLLSSRDVPIPQICASANTTSSLLPHRLIVAGGSHLVMAERLHLFCVGCNETPGVQYVMQPLVAVAGLHALDDILEPEDSMQIPLSPRTISIHSAGLQRLSSVDSMDDRLDSRRESVSSAFSAQAEQVNLRPIRRTSTTRLLGDVEMDKFAPSPVTNLTAAQLLPSGSDKAQTGPITRIGRRPTLPFGRMVLPQVALHTNPLARLSSLQRLR
eukprot:TRINITY_DN6656_c0_g1_i1.p1 TRINITY_DN6656_c0_g1~~TRINITY_DN6656_c0_g1_i1.p1  ORF type:complete len:985 (-),score=193.37 TRINITY_DN6656_c0_g1_i1:126-3026(-)